MEPAHILLNVTPPTQILDHFNLEMKTRIAEYEQAWNKYITNSNQWPSEWLKCVAEIARFAMKFIRQTAESAFLTDFQKGEMYTSAYKQIKSLSKDFKINREKINYEVLDSDQQMNTDQWETRAENDIDDFFIVYHYHTTNKSASCLRCLKQA
jgi:hypothetical protein